MTSLYFLTPYCRTANVDIQERGFSAKNINAARLITELTSFAGKPASTKSLIFGKLHFS
jgi:hypothetical protein